MNILIMVKDYASGKKYSRDGMPMKSGGEFHAENHAKQLIKMGHNVSLMTKKKYWFTKARETIDGIDIVRLHAPFRWLEIIIRLFTTHSNIDVIYIIGSPKFSVWAILIGKLLGKPVTIASTINDEAFENRNNWRNKILNSCDNFVAMSREIKRGFLEAGGIKEDKIKVLPQGVDTKRFYTISAKEKNTLRKKYKIEQNACIVLFCGRLSERKGIDTIIKLWPLVHRDNKDAFLLIVGGGTQDWFDGLKKLSGETDNSVIIIGEADNPKEYYQLSDIFLFPSRAEGLPNTLQEAMSCGLVPVTSAIGGCEDLVQNSETGFLVQAEDYKRFAEKLIYLINNEEERERLGENARKFIVDYCDYSNVMWKLEEILKKK